MSRTLPVWEWRRGTSGRWFARCEALDGSRYDGLVVPDADLGGWIAVLVYTPSVAVDASAPHDIHRSEHTDRDAACGALGGALARAIKLREGPNQGPRTEKPQHQPKETDHAGQGIERDETDHEGPR